MSDGDIYLYGGFILICMAIVAYIIDSKKAWWILDEKLGKKIEIKNENGTFAKPKDLPVEFFDANRNKLNWSGARPKGKSKYDLLDDAGKPFKEIDFRRPHVWLNCDNFMTGKGGSELVFQLVDEDYISKLRDDIDALQLGYANKAEEVTKHSRSTELVVQSHASAENKRIHNLWRGRRFQTRQNKSKKSEPEQMSIPDEGEGDEG